MLHNRKDLSDYFHVILQMEVDVAGTSVDVANTNGDSEYAIVNEGKASVLFPGEFIFM